MCGCTPLICDDCGKEIDEKVARRRGRFNKEKMKYAEENLHLGLDPVRDSIEWVLLCSECTIR
jgi:hypothetical protein